MPGLLQWPGAGGAPVRQSARSGTRRLPLGHRKSQRTQLAQSSVTPSPTWHSQLFKDLLILAQYVGRRVRTEAF